MRISRTQIQVRISRTQIQMRISHTQRRSGAVTEPSEAITEAIREAIREPSRNHHLPDEHLATKPVLPTNVQLSLAQLRQRRRPQVYR